MRKTSAPQFSDRYMVAVRRPERHTVLEDLQAGPQREADGIALREQIRGLDRPTKAPLLQDDCRVDAAFEERRRRTRDRAGRRRSADHIAAPITVGGRIVRRREKEIGAMMRESTMALSCDRCQIAVVRTEFQPFFTQPYLRPQFFPGPIAHSKHGADLGRPAMSLHMT